MTDYSELKRLAEASMVTHPTFAENSKAAILYGEASEADVVLALIADNEALHESDQEATELCDTLSVLLGEIAVAVRGPEEPKSRHGFHDLPSRVKTVVAERDRLKAENDRSTEREIHQLAEIEALRKALTECTSSLEGEVLQKYHGQKPEDMHPVTRRDYDRDMAEINGYKAMSKEG